MRAMRERTRVLHSGRLGGLGGAPLTDRDRARRAFVAAGRPYAIPPTAHYPPAEHIVAPAALGDPFVRWWAEEHGG